MLKLEAVKQPEIKELKNRFEIVSKPNHEWFVPGLRFVCGWLNRSQVGNLLKRSVNAKQKQIKVTRFVTCNDTCGLLSDDSKILQTLSAVAPS